MKKQVFLLTAGMCFLNLSMQARDVESGNYYDYYYGNPYVNQNQYGNPYGNQNPYGYQAGSGNPYANPYANQNGYVADSANSSVTPNPSTSYQGGSARTYGNVNAQPYAAPTAQPYVAPTAQPYMAPSTQPYVNPNPNSPQAAPANPYNNQAAPARAYGAPITTTPSYASQNQNSFQSDSSSNQTANNYQARPNKPFVSSFAQPYAQPEQNGFQGGAASYNANPYTASYANQGNYGGESGSYYGNSNFYDDSYAKSACPQDCVAACSFGKFSVGASWLYWKTDQTGLLYGSEITGAGSAEVVTRSLSPKDKYKNGYRIFGDFIPTDSPWIFSAAFTHAPSSAHHTFSGTSVLSTDVVNLFGNLPAFSAFSGSVFTSLTSNWSSKTNYLDLLASRSFDVCENIQITPYLGTRALWLDQKFRLSGTNTAGASFTSLLSGRISGLGSSGGLKAVWNIYEGFSFLTDIGGSILYAWNRSHGELSTLTTTTSADILGRNTGRGRGIPTFDTFFGLKYANSWEKYSYSFHVGWEEHIIYDTSEFSLNSNGNTTLQGLTLGAAVSF